MTKVLLVAGLLLTLGCRTVPGRDVRFEPTPMPAVRAMLELAHVGPDDVVFDLGSGDGRIPITAAREFGARGVGIEIDAALVARAQANAAAAGVGHMVEFRLGDMHAADVRSATVVTLFLHPRPNLELRPKLRSELPLGSRIVSYIWDMGDWMPDEVRRINRRRIFLWRIPTRGSGRLRGVGLRRDARVFEAQRVSWILGRLRPRIPVAVARRGRTRDRDRGSGIEAPRPTGRPREAVGPSTPPSDAP